MINFLKLVHVLINRRFDSTNTPHDCPVIFLLLWTFLKAIVFKSVFDYFDLCVLKFVVVAFVTGSIRLESQRLNVRSEYQILLHYFIRHFSVNTDNLRFLRIKNINLHIF